MRIQNTALSLNALRNLSTHNNRIAQAMQRLSSGFRINSAADDPAGLAVSEKLKMQLTQLDTSKKNAIDHQSALQIADGSLSEIQSMLNRMYELANMSANGTNSETDRQQLDKEYQQLLEEINRVGSSTGLSGNKLFSSNNALNTEVPSNTREYSSSGILIQGGDLNAFLDEIDKLTKEISEAAKNGDNDKLLSLGIDRSNGKSDGENLQNAIIEFTKNNTNQFLKSPASQGKNGGSRYTLNISGGNITVDILAVDSESIGLDDTNLLTSGNAQKAADAIKGAIDYVSSQRGSIGATYNRLEHTINNLATMSENLTDSLSRILDTDMAAEMMVLVKEKALAQASMFALAQANQQPDQVLSLINSM